MATPGATRHRSLAGLPDQIFDLVVVGGGINGVGIARDAAGLRRRP
jgi:glycerol-3-phosphate dehydrogenase